MARIPTSTIAVHASDPGIVRFQKKNPRFLRGLSRTLGSMANWRASTPLIGWLGVRPLKWAVITCYMRYFNIDMTDYVGNKPGDFHTMNAFFGRALTKSARPIAADPRAIIAPADGRIAQIGTLDANGRLDGEAIRAKGFNFSLHQLLGAEDTFSRSLFGGNIATIYLSPKDYHRYHMPFDAQVTQMTFIPGDLFAVNTKATHHIDGLFARNERVVLHLATNFGPAAIILVGAWIVGSIHVNWKQGRVRHPTSGEVYIERYPEIDTYAFAKGADFGQFNIGGSTVIFVMSEGVMDWTSGLLDTDMQMGQTMGMLRTR